LLFPAPDICVQILDLIAGCVIIVADWHSTNHNHESSIFQLLKVTWGCFGRALPQICCRLLVASRSLLLRLLNVLCTFLQIRLNPLWPNPFRIIGVFHRQSGPHSLQNIWNHCLPVLGSLSKHCQMVLSTDNGPILLLKKPSHPYLLSQVDSTNVELPHPFGKLLQGEFHLLQAEWGFGFGTAQV
jgi:hypothetical protein